VGDRIPVGGDDTKTFFTTAEIDDLWNQHIGNFNGAAFQGWLDKMAEYAKLIDSDISGAARKFSQLYKQAEGMLRHYGALIGADTESIIGRVVGRAINLRETVTPPAVMPVSSGFRSEARNARAKQILANSHPDTMDVDPSYPESGPVATS
jgi:hypothetical protein